MLLMPCASVMSISTLYSLCSGTTRNLIHGGTDVPTFDPTSKGSKWLRNENRPNCLQLPQLQRNRQTHHIKTDSKPRHLDSSPCFFIIWVIATALVVLGRLSRSPPFPSICKPMVSYADVIPWIDIISLALSCSACVNPCPFLNSLHFFALLYNNCWNFLGCSYISSSNQSNFCQHQVATDGVRQSSIGCPYLWPKYWMKWPTGTSLMWNSVETGNDDERIWKTSIVVFATLQNHGFEVYLSRHYKWWSAERTGKVVFWFRWA